MPEERQAILACKAGNTEDFRFIVDKYKERAYQAAYYYTGKPRRCFGYFSGSFLPGFPGDQTF